MIQRCVIYTRVSTDFEAQAKSMDNQEALMRSHIEKQGWIYYGTYKDEAVTAVGTKIREDYNRLIEDARAKKFDIILAKSLTRFSRNLRDGLNDISNLMQQGIRVIFIEDNFDTADHQAYHLLGLRLWLAETEARNTSERIRSTWKVHNMQGKMHACTPPYGYRYEAEANTLVIEEAEALVVQKIFNLYLEGYGMASIAKELIRQQIPTKKGGQWAQATIKSILSNRVYTGVIIQGKYFHADITNKKKQRIEEENWYVHENIHKGMKQQIIDDKTFYKVQQELAKRSAKRARHSNTALFSGIIKCGECGSSFTVKRQKHFKNYTTYYTCITYDHKGKEIAGHERIALYEGDLLIGIENYLNTLRDTNYEGLLHEYSRRCNSEKQIQQLEKAFTKNKKAQDDLYTLYYENLKFKQQGELTQRLFQVSMERIDTQLAQLEKEAENLERQLQVLTVKRPDPQGLQKEIDRLLDAKAFTNTTMRKIVSQMTIYKDGKIEVELNVAPSS